MLDITYNIYNNILCKINCFGYILEREAVYRGVPRCINSPQPSVKPMGKKQNGLMRNDSGHFSARPFLLSERVIFQQICKILLWIN